VSPICYLLLSCGEFAPSERRRKPAVQPKVPQIRRSPRRKQALTALSRESQQQVLLRRQQLRKLPTLFCRLREASELHPTATKIPAAMMCLMCLSSLPRLAARSVVLAIRSLHLQRAVPVDRSLVDIGRGGNVGETASHHRDLSAALVAMSWFIPSVTSLGFVMVAAGYRRHA